MTRGDIFRNPFFRKLLESANMFPVFRQRDGYQGRDRNDEVFEFCQKKLVQRSVLNIFVEGEHHLDKRVLPAQKGFARIAFGTYERHRLDDLQILPVGCNYVSGISTRDEAKIIVGEPLFVKDYWPVYETNPNAAINQLCRDVEKALKTICYHIEDPADDQLVEQLICLWRNDHPADHLPIVETIVPRFFGEKELINTINALPEPEKNAVRQKSEHYFSTLKEKGLNDEGLAHPEHAGFRWILLLLFTAPVALAGFLIGWPVRLLAYRITAKTVKKRAFYTSVLMGLAVILGALYFIILLILGFISNTPGLITLALLMPLLAWCSVFWKETLQRFRYAKKGLNHPERERLLALRQAIWS